MTTEQNFKAEIIADSINDKGNRLTTFLLVFPRIVLAEFNTHRMLSRNSASSRAIPFKTMLDRVEQNPFIPLDWMKDHKGMQGKDFFDDDKCQNLENLWLKARDRAVVMAKVLSDEGLTKQIVNRLLEPWLWHTVIVTATDWQNFFSLRAHHAAEIHIQHLAYKMLQQYNGNTPKRLGPGEWHVPFGDQLYTDRMLETLETCIWETDERIGTNLEALELRIATARCARVSYLNYEGKDDYEADVKLHDKLIQMGHWSPFEHCAQNITSTQERSGNFVGFEQYRKMFAGENRTDNRVKHKYGQQNEK